MEEININSAVEIAEKRMAEIRKSVQLFFVSLKNEYDELGSKSDVYLVMKRLSAIFNVDMDESYCIFAYTVRGSLYDYFCRETFMTIGEAARRNWFKAIMLYSLEGLEFIRKGALSAFPDRELSVASEWEYIYTSKTKLKEIIKDQKAVHQILKKRSERVDGSGQEAVQKDRNAEIRNNRPLSDYEYQDPVSGMRFYDDPSDGRVPILSTAPPRPCNGSQWHHFRKCWCIAGKPIEADGQYVMSDSGGLTP